MLRARRDRLLDRYVADVKATEVQPWIALLIDKTDAGFTARVNGRPVAREGVPANDLAFAGGSIVVGSEVVLLASESGQDTPTILGLSSWSVHGG